jgi:hypothetical protein
MGWLNREPWFKIHIIRIHWLEALPRRQYGNIVFFECGLRLALKCIFQITRATLPNFHLKKDNKYAMRGEKT